MFPCMLAFFLKQICRDWRINGHQGHGIWNQDSRIQEPVPSQGQERRGETRWAFKGQGSCLRWGGFWLNDTWAVKSSLGPWRKREMLLPCFCRMGSACALSCGWEFQAAPGCELFIYCVVFLFVGDSQCCCCVINTHILFLPWPQTWVSCGLCLVFRKEKSPGKTLDYLPRLFQKLSWLCNHLTF